MSEREQQLVEREVPADYPGVPPGLDVAPAPPYGLGAARTATEDGERAARRSLRAQIAKLERELSLVVLNTFPHISPADGELAAAPAGAGPMLQSLEQLERSRDRLAGRVSELQALAADRADHERRAREQLERMRLEPGRYKFVRLPVERSRGRRMRCVGGASAPGHHRHARRLVAAQAVVRLSVTQGVAFHARPLSAEASIVASVRR